MGSGPSGMPSSQPGMGEGQNILPVADLQWLAGVRLNEWMLYNFDLASRSASRAIILEMSISGDGAVMHLPRLLSKSYASALGFDGDSNVERLIIRIFDQIGSYSNAYAIWNALRTIAEKVKAGEDFDLSSLSVFRQPN